MLKLKSAEIELNKSNLTQICELIYLLEKPIFVCKLFKYDYFDVNTFHLLRPKIITS